MTEEHDASRIWSHVFTWSLLTLFASGVLVKTVPLTTQRPLESSPAQLTTGRQDIEARLWDDPFTFMRDIRAKTAQERCDLALGDAPHHPARLAQSIRRYTDAKGTRVTVMPVMVPTGPYFEDAEARRRYRYAVVQGLMQSDWHPQQGDKLGFVWTLESCIERHWQRRAPELVPYEWFCKGESCDGSSALLVLWTDEDAVARRPLEGIETLIARLADPNAACPRQATPTAPDTDFGHRNRHLREAIGRAGLPPAILEHFCTAATPSAAAVTDPPPRQPPSLCRVRCLEGPWERTTVLGPMLSTTLNALVRELDKDRQDLPRRSPLNSNWIRFLSSGATVSWKDLGAPEGAPPDSRLVRLTATDDILAEALVDELRLRRLTRGEYWQALFAPQPPVAERGKGDRLCDGLVVLVSEGDATYARHFRKHLEEKLACPRAVGDAGRPIHEIRYLRGLDGAAPQAREEYKVAAKAEEERRQAFASDKPLQTPPSERAEGARQFDYLTRLAEHLRNVDARHRQQGRRGVLAVGIIGSDVYDKLLVLEALKPSFPDVVFFTTDLDARFADASRERRAARNLVVASPFGLQLAPALQGATPPFRDTYQTGLYLATRLAVDEGSVDSAAGTRWFEEARRFEIGRTRPVSLAGCPTRPLCATVAPDPRLAEPALPKPGVLDRLEGGLQCPAEPPAAPCTIHADEPLTESPIRVVLRHWLELLGAGLSAVLLVLFASGRARRSFLALKVSAARVGGGILLVLLTVAGMVVLVIDAQSSDGEPFVWAEGVSLWPTQLIRVLTLAVIFLLLWFGRTPLKSRFDAIAARFRMNDMAAAARRVPMEGSVEWLWWSPAPATAVQPASEPRALAARPEVWDEYLARMTRTACAARIGISSVLFTILAFSLMALAWPNSPHRGAFSAVVNEGLFVLVLLLLSVLLFAALDVQAMTRRFLERLTQDEESRWPRALVDQLAQQYSVETRFLIRFARFRLAVEVATAVSGFIYLPFIALPFVFVARSTIFDAWDFPVPYVTLLALVTVMAIGGAVRLRSAANQMRKGLLEDLQTAINARELQYFSSPFREEPQERRRLVAARATHGIAQSTSASARLASRSRAPAMAARGDPRDVALRSLGSVYGLETQGLERIQSQVQEVRTGPFRPVTQEPAVRAVLAFLGTGGLTAIVEALVA